MILKREIEKHAEANKIAKSTIDKDWVLAHFIDAIFSMPECREQLVFKGGTCLRKCYFPDYRFSEDLDFTVIGGEFVLDKKLLSRITALITERTEIPLYIQEIAPLHFNDELTGYHAVVKFWGADHPRNQAPPVPNRWTTSVKMEIILYEKMVFPIEERVVSHPYSDDLSQTPLSIPCYSLQEVLAEKMRSLIQRSYAAPRDFYDIWYLSQFPLAGSPGAGSIDWQEVTAAFHEKLKFKGHEFTGIDQIINKENDRRVKAAWENSLRHQVPEKDFVEYEVVREVIVDLLERILG